MFNLCDKTTTNKSKVRKYFCHFISLKQSALDKELVFTGWQCEAQGCQVGFSQRQVVSARTWLPGWVSSLPASLHWRLTRYHSSLWRENQKGVNEQDTFHKHIWNMALEMKGLGVFLLTWGGFILSDLWW